MSDLTGTKLGRYRIIERLGQGGMATVYKAFDTRLEREVAIKTIRTDMFPPAVLPDVLARFEREAKALARLDHPNILRVHDYGDEGNVPYLVMAFVTGGSLRDQPRRIYTPEEAFTLLAPVARALEYAHAMGILHRDIKPANILISSRGIPMLSDFGIAKILDAGSNDGLTATGMAIGTPEYMAPEQSSGEKVDARADIYALGVVLFELLTGRRPFEGNTPIDVMIKTRTAPLPTLSSLGMNVSPEIEAIVYRALARETSERYATMGSFADGLESVLSSINRKHSTASNPGILPTQAPITPSPSRPSTPPPVDDSGRTINQPTPAPSSADELDSGRTVTTPPPPPIYGTSETAVIAGPAVEQRTAITPATPIPAPPPPPSRDTSPPQVKDLPVPDKNQSHKFPVWGYFVIIIGLILMIGGGIWALNRPEAPEESVLPGDTPGSGANQTNDIVIQIWDTWSDDMEIEATRALLVDYQARNPGVTISLVKVGEQEIMAALQDGTGPDILIHSSESIGPFSEGLIGLNEHGITLQILKNRFVPVAVDGVIWQDQIWGIPLAQKAIAIVYNKKLVTPLDFPQEPNDLNLLVKKAYEYYQRTGKYMICNPGFSEGEAYFAAPIFFSMGAPGYLNEKGVVFVNTYASHEAGRILKVWKITAGPQEANYDHCKAMFQNEEAAGWWVGPWEKWLFTDPDLILAVAKMGKPFVTLRTASLTTNSLHRDHVKQAIDIINFLSQPDSQAHMALTAFSIPVSDAAMAAPEIRENSLLSGFFNTGILGIPISPSPYSKFQWHPMSEAIRKIWNGDQLPAEALAIAHKQIVDAINNSKVK